MQYMNWFLMLIQGKNLHCYAVEIHYTISTKVQTELVYNVDIFFQNTN